MISSACVYDSHSCDCGVFLSNHPWRKWQPPYAMTGGWNSANGPVPQSQWSQVIMLNSFAWRTVFLIECSMQSGNMLSLHADQEQLVDVVATDSL